MQKYCISQNKKNKI